MKCENCQYYYSGNTWLPDDDGICEWPRPYWMAPNQTVSGTKEHYCEVWEEKITSGRQND